MPGVAAGALMVFMLAVGFYITPALVGGPDDQMVSYFIAFYTNNDDQLGHGRGARDAAAGRRPPCWSSSRAIWCRASAPEA